MTYITIDFSLNSPGICVYHKDQYTFISYLKPKSGTKKEQKLQEEMAQLSDVIFVEQPDFKNDFEYSSAELAKVKRYATTSNDIIKIIRDLVPGETNFMFAFEGTSFGSKMGTNNIIDMAAGAAILKMKLIDEFNPTDIQTIAPSTIKKHAGKGNMNKLQLWEKFLVNVLDDEELSGSPFFTFCNHQIGSNIKKIPKPFDDLVDAYFLNHLIKSI